MNLVESRFSKCKGRSEYISCYITENSTTLRYEDVIGTRCQTLFSSVVVYDSVARGDLDLSLVEFQAIQVGWWLTGRCRCHQYAYCSHVGTIGFRCRCRPGFTGDGFIDGEGCRKIRYVTKFENNKIGRAYPGDDELHSLIRLSSSQGKQCKCKGRRLLLVEVLIAFVGGFGLMSLILLIVYFTVRSGRKYDKLSQIYRRKKNKLSQVSSLKLKSPFLKVSYNMLLKATKGFSNENLVGVGHFGSVYKGVLDLDKKNMVVAVKIFSLDLKGATKSFMAECEALRMSRHRNLLKVVTACSSMDFKGNDFKALVYEFMPNGNLQQWIHIGKYERTLNLIQRVNIAIDVACALDYLHNYCDIPIIHCDLKPSNILLDNDMVAHVGDFGLARFHLHARVSYSSSLAVRGTVGYVAPEYGLGSIVSEEGDIYSYGIVLLEMMTAKTPTDRMFGGDLDLHKYAKSALLTDQLSKIIDPRLLDARNGNQDETLASTDCYIKCIKSVVKVGLKCSVQSSLYRITIKDAINELLGTKDKLLKELRIINRYMYCIDG
ncbi:probable LRR receptor-like serine/threonine-protein kinase At3g47570 [Chenopodium quinoa]|uniref:non-specific serine/threonine protein kinase n=1 Tax=Chenopodium quinoa TaxID=63459 RepID=A0A803KW66_CHEQI|nr:probable LRR receptor-like serine/threonine-protein kinase At3g47570 [Chenopodium quinoa]